MLSKDRALMFRNWFNMIALPLYDMHNTKIELTSLEDISVIAFQKVQLNTVLSEKLFQINFFSHTVNYRNV